MNAILCVRLVGYILSVSLSLSLSLCEGFSFSLSFIGQTTHTHTYMNSSILSECYTVCEVGWIHSFFGCLSVCLSLCEGFSFSLSFIGHNTHMNNVLNECYTVCEVGWIHGYILLFFFLLSVCLSVSLYMKDFLSLSASSDTPKTHHTYMNSSILNECYTVCEVSLSVCLSLSVKDFLSLSASSDTTHI
jgi:hypothetical protein